MDVFALFRNSRIEYEYFRGEMYWRSLHLLILTFAWNCEFTNDYGQYLKSQNVSKFRTINVHKVDFVSF